MKKVSDKSTAKDVQIAAGLVSTGLLSPQGLQQIQKVLQGANDPAKALAHVIYMALSSVRQKLAQRGLDIDHRVWIMGGGVLDRVMFEIMNALATALKIKQAADPQFVHQVKSDVLDLMEDDDKNSEAIKVLHDKGLPAPKVDPSGGPQAGLAAPQPQQMGGQMNG